MARIDFDTELAAVHEPLEFKLFDRIWHGQQQMTLGEKRRMMLRITQADQSSDLAEVFDEFMDMLGSMVIPAEKEEFISDFMEKGDEALAKRVMERLMEAFAGRPTPQPNGSSKPSGRTTARSTATARPVE